MKLNENSNKKWPTFQRRSKSWKIKYLIGKCVKHVLRCVYGFKFFNLKYSNRSLFLSEKLLFHEDIIPWNPVFVCCWGIEFVFRNIELVDEYSRHSLETYSLITC